MVRIQSEFSEQFIEDEQFVRRSAVPEVKQKQKNDKKKKKTKTKTNYTEMTLVGALPG